MIKSNFGEFSTTIDTLCERFERYRPQYRKGLDESTLRLEYLDPLFRSLGWDVSNSDGHPPHLREVRVEYPTHDGSSNRRADYVFRINGFDRLVIEAKKFPEKIEQHAYQIQNYVYNLRLWIGIITNFDQLQLYIVGGQPDKNRPFSVVPGWNLCHQDYPAAKRKLWDLLSYECVSTGSLEKLLQDIPKIVSKKQRQLWLIKPNRDKAVDKNFLHYLENERAKLAKILIAHNPKIAWTKTAINEAVQRILDRLIFQTVCEDRDIDTFQPLQQAVHRWESDRRPQGGLWHHIVRNHSNLRAAFNGGLFGRAGQKAHFIEDLIIPDQWLAEFIDHLSGDDSPYLFSTLPIEILGSVYERFLSRVVDENGDVHPKPEVAEMVRKQGGVYYTPSHIVKHIVDHSVGPLVEGKSVDQLSKIKILDPACGSGTFLIHAFDRVCQAYVEYYHKNGKYDEKNAYIDSAGDIRLTSDLKKRIASSSIFGVDIDKQAVEVAEMSIYLKILEGETKSTLNAQKKLFPDETFLPNLANNLREGNSLVDIDAYHLLPGVDTFSMKPFSWNQKFPEIMSRGGFDAVIGNPPYDVLEKERNHASWPHDLFRSYLRKTKRLDAAKGGKLNLFRFFIIQAVELTRPNGYFGMIVPMALLADITSKRTRGFLLEKAEKLDIGAFPQKDNRNERVFFEAKLSTTVIQTKKRQASRRRHDPDIDLKVYPRATFEDEAKTVTMRRSDLIALDPENAPIPITDQRGWDLAQKIHSSNSVCRLDAIAGINISRGEINQKVFEDFITTDKRHNRMLKGVEVAPFRIKNKLSQGQMEWFDRSAFAKQSQVPACVGLRRIATQRITGIDERRRIVAAIAEAGWFFADSTNSIVVDQACQLSEEYILAALNSKIMQWRFKLTSSNNNVGTNELAALPIRMLDLSDRSDKAAHVAIVGQVKAAAKFGAQIESSASDAVQERAAEAFYSIMDDLDQRFYRIYGLTPNDITIIENSM